MRDATIRTAVFTLQAELDFPFPDPPGPGTATEVAPGVLWVRMALPFLLDHVNLYLLEDGPGWALIDTGIDNRATRDAWDALLTGPLKGRMLTRLVVTHCHPDHVGLAGWLFDRFGLPLLMSRTEYLMTQNIRFNSEGIGSASHREFYVRRGLGSEAVDALLDRGHAYLRMTSGLPPTFTRLLAGETLEIGGRSFEVLTGGGHSPEQAMLLCRADKLFFAADQVLARISPNISVWPWEPEEDPLGEYLASLGALGTGVPDDVLVLAAHNLPFRGLHRRLDELRAHHGTRLAALLAACAAEPRTDAALIPALFRRQLDAHQMGFAFGETVAHVNRLVRDGALVREARADEVMRVSLAAGASGRLAGRDPARTLATVSAPKV